MPNAITKDILEKETKNNELKEFFNAKVILNSIPIEPQYNLIRGSELEKLIEIPVSSISSDAYCIEVKFLLPDIGEIITNKEIEKYCEFDSYIFKYKNNINIHTHNAFDKIHVDWDCTDTDILGVELITSIDNRSQPVSRHPQNLKHSIISYSPGLPGNQIVYVWRFANEDNISSQTELELTTE
jgi:hypothetical protein